MRRRRQKNTLLPKMIGLAVLINAILLPILAQFGVFKSIGGRQRLTQVELVKLPPPEKRPAPPKKTPKKQVARRKPAGHKAATRTAAVHRVPSGPPPVKVVAAAGPAGANGGGGDTGITTSDSGPVTPLPTPPVTPNSVPPVPVPTPVPITPPPPAPIPAPVSVAPPPPHIPVVTAAAPLEQPHPAIPDDLRDTDLNADFEGLFTVHPDGTASVKMVSSTGNSSLDTLALNAARHWTFRAATKDGQPIESYLRLKIEFEVNS
jgi:TonB family protein